MLQWYYILLFAFLRLSTPDNITDPVWGPLIEKGFDEFYDGTFLNSLIQLTNEVSEVKDSYFDSLVQLGNEFSGSVERGCQSSDSGSQEKVREWKHSQSSSAYGFELSNTAMKANEDSTQARPSTSGLNDEARGERRRKYQCEFENCRERFMQYQSFCDHLTYHNEDGVHLCNWPNCGISLSDPQMLSDHYKEHWSRKPFGCRYCDKSFAYSKCLKRHCFKVHMQRGFFICCCGSCHIFSVIFSSVWNNHRVLK